MSKETEDHHLPPQPLQALVKNLRAGCVYEGPHDLDSVDVERTETFMREAAAAMDEAKWIIEQVASMDHDLARAWLRDYYSSAPTP